MNYFTRCDAIILPHEAHFLAKRMSTHLDRGAVSIWRAFGGNKERCATITELCVILCADPPAHLLRVERGTAMKKSLSLLWLLVLLIGILPVNVFAAEQPEKRQGRNILTITMW